MKNLKLVVLLIAISSQVFGQNSLDNAKNEINKENYIKAKKILQSLLNDGSADRNQVLYFLGNAYMKNDEGDSAKIFYGMMGGAENKTSWGYLGNGRLNLLNKNIAAAKESFDKAATRSKMKDAEILFQAGDALYSPIVSDLPAAIGYFEDAYKLDNKNYMNMLELGDAYLKNNEGGKAMSKYESAADVNPKLTMAFMKIGRLNTNARTYDDAIIAYKKAIALEPDYALAHKELAEAYYLNHKYDLAKPEFKRYIDLNKDDADAKTKFLMFLFQIKEYDQCATEEQNMQTADPTNFIVLRALFYCDYELKRYKEGMDVAQRFWLAAPQAKVKPYDYVATAKLATKTGDTTTAMKYFATALQLDSNNDELLSDYAQLMYNSKRYYDAVTYYTLKVNRFPAKAAFLDYYYMGRANYYIAMSFKAKKDDAAAADSATFYFVAADTAFSNLTTTKWGNTPDGWQWRAKTNIKLDPEMKATSAKTYYEQYIKLTTASADPSKYKNGLLDAYDYIGAYSLNAKDNDAAKGYFNKALELDPNDEFAKDALKGIK